MLLAFASKRLRAICEDESTALAEIGPEVSATLKRRLADLDAATSIYDVPVGWSIDPESAQNQDLIINLGNRHYLVGCANHPKPPVTEAGGIDWKRVSRIKLLDIKEHDGTQ